MKSRALAGGNGGWRCRIKRGTARGSLEGGQISVALDRNPFDVDYVDLLVSDCFDHVTPIPQVGGGSTAVWDGLIEFETIRASLPVHARCAVRWVCCMHDHREYLLT